MNRSVFALAAAWLAMASTQGLAAPAQNSSSPPNVVFIFADDKYELGRSKIENTRKNRTKRAICGQFQITGNYGESGQITGN